jgi:16S rRNA U516 pseudouridylate synthase RsuA-like enzyme
VTRLLRVSFGGVELGTLPPGRWRPLTYDELRTLRDWGRSR